MKLRTMGYHFQQTFLSLVRNFWMSLASVGTVAITLLILGAAFLTMVNATFIASTVQSDVEINVYLKEALSYSEAKEFADALDSVPGIAKAQFVSKNNALQELKKSLDDGSGGILEAIGENNPLPHTYRVKTEDPSQVPLIAKKIEALKDVEKVRYGQGVVEKLISLSKWIKTAGFVVMGALFLAAVFLIATTIRLTVFARREEIEIMKFLGATNWFIRWPFLFEGILLGLLGAGFAVAIIFFGYDSLVSNVKTSFDFIPVKDDLETILMVGEGLLAIGVIIGALGSIVSMRKYLKV